MRGEEERICARRRRRRRRRRRKGHKGPKSDCGRGEARPAIFARLGGAPTFSRTAPEGLERVAALELQIEDSIRRLDAF